MTPRTTCCNSVSFPHNVYVFSIISAVKAAHLHTEYTQTFPSNGEERVHWAVETGVLYKQNSYKRQFSLSAAHHLALFWRARGQGFARHPVITKQRSKLVLEMER
jgi:hypothetical protein